MKVLNRKQFIDSCPAGVLFYKLIPTRVEPVDSNGIALPYGDDIYAYGPLCKKGASRQGADPTSDGVFDYTQLGFIRLGRGSGELLQSSVNLLNPAGDGELYAVLTQGEAQAILDELTESLKVYDLMYTIGGN